MCGAELTVLPEGVQRVAAVLEAHNHPHSPIMLDDAARTAQQAADALGIMLGRSPKASFFAASRTTRRCWLSRPVTSAWMKKSRSPGVS